MRLTGKGGAWSPCGTIVFGPNLIFEGLVKVQANGGKVEPATLVDLDRGENSHRWPVFLPDGVHFLYFVRASVDARRGVYVARIDQPASKPGVTALRLGIRSDVRPDVRTRARSAALGRRRPTAGTAVRRCDARAPWGSAHVARGRGRKHSLSSGDVQRVGRPARHGRDADAIRRAAWLPSREMERWRADVGSFEAQNWPRLSPGWLDEWPGRSSIRRGEIPMSGSRTSRTAAVIRVTTDTGSDLLPVWSPDGRRLAYGSGQPDQASTEHRRSRCRPAPR